MGFFSRILLSYIKDVFNLLSLNLGNLSSVPLNDGYCMCDFFDGSLFSS